MESRRCFELFIEENLDSAYRFAYLYTGTRQDAEDVVSESVVRALRAIKSLREPSMVKTWFYRIMINTARNMYKANPCTVPESEIEAVLPAAEGGYAAVDIADIIDKLPPEHRILIALHYYEGYKLAELADMLQLSESAVKKRLFTARNNLKNTMEDK